MVTWNEKYPGYGYDKPSANPPVTPGYKERNPDTTSPVQDGGGGGGGGSQAPTQNYRPGEEPVVGGHITKEAEQQWANAGGGTASSGIYYTKNELGLAKQSVEPVRTTTITQIPQQRIQSQISQQQIAQQSYNEQVKNAYGEIRNKQEVTYDWKLFPPASYTYPSGELRIFKGDLNAESDISHEIGHKLDFEQQDIKDYTKYKSASKNWLPDIFENIGYSKADVQREYYARAFNNFISNPQSFKNKYPEVASEFESRLGLNQSLESSNSKFINSFVSPSTTGVTLAIEKSTGRIAKQYNLSTSNANLTDVYFTKNSQGIWSSTDSDIKQTKTLTPISQQGATLQNQPMLTVSPVNKPTGFFNTISSNIEYQRNLLSTQEARGKINPLIYNIKDIGLGIASTGLGLIRTVQHPIESAKGTFYSVTHPLETGEKIGEVLRTEPGYATGIVIGTYLTGKGTEFILTKGVTSGVDIYRTKGLTELETKNVVAPEFFKGQKYPQISKGEKAGQLLEEFKEGGYTASPKPIKPEKGVLPGSSELPGLYQAPKVSPAFLKVSSEEKTAFSFNPFGTLRPTVSKVTPTAYELAPGVSYGSSVNPSKLGSIKQFFIEGAEKGKAYVPFIKTEKEAVIPSGTMLEQLPTKEYFKFEGRKIPIEEFKTISREGREINPNKIKNINEISYSSYKSIGSRGYINPSNILSSIGLSSSNIKSSVSSVNKSYSSYAKPSYSTQSYGSPNISSSNNLISKGSSLSSNIRSASPSVSIGSISKSNYGISKSYSGTSKGYSSRGYFSYGTTGNIILPQYKEFGKRKKLKRVKGISQPIAYTPSLGSSVFNIKLSNQRDIKSGKVSVFRRRGTLSLAQLRKINQGNSIF